MNVSPSQIVIGAGTEYLYNLVIQLLGRDQIYALENPGHHSISKVYQLNQIQYQYISLDQYGLCVDELLKSHAHICLLYTSQKVYAGLQTPIIKKLFDDQKLISMLEDHKNQKHDYYKKIWTVYCFSLWHQVFFAEEYENQA